MTYRKVPVLLHLKGQINLSNDCFIFKEKKFKKFQVCQGWSCSLSCPFFPWFWLQPKRAAPGGSGSTKLQSTGTTVCSISQLFCCFCVAVPRRPVRISDLTLGQAAAADPPRYITIENLFIVLKSTLKAVNNRL